MGTYNDRAVTSSEKYMTTKPHSNDVEIEGLAKELRMVAHMINMREKIQWARETTLMDKAADMLETLHQELQKARAEEVQLFRKTLQDRASTIPPNLLLNEVVNYAFDRTEVINHSELDQPNIVPNPAFGIDIQQNSELDQPTYSEIPNN